MKGGNNNMGFEKNFKDIFREINKQNFQSEEEMRTYLNNFMKNNVEPIEKSKEEESQDLVYEAYELPFEEGKKLIDKALELDANNAEAYNYLANNEGEIEAAVKLYKKAIEVAKQTIGEEKFKLFKGNFWIAFETRPFMRAKAGLANCLKHMDKKEEAIEIFEELLELNPNDNQGIRYLLSPLYLELDNFKGFEKLNKNYKDDSSADAFYNVALCEYKKNGKSKKADKLLLKAYKQNIHVIDFLLGDKTIPDVLPQYVGRGDQNEAIIYAHYNWHLWETTEDALEWAFLFRADRIEMN